MVSLNEENATMEEVLPEKKEKEAVLAREKIHFNADIF